MEEEEESELEEQDEIDDQPAPQTQSRTRNPVNPKYTVINRNRPSTAAPLDEEESVEEEVVEKEVVTPKRLKTFIFCHPLIKCLYYLDCQES